MSIWDRQTPPILQSEEAWKEEETPSAQISSFPPQHANLLEWLALVVPIPMV